MMPNLHNAQKYLDNGEVDAAREVLEAALREKPTSKRALKMMHELEAAQAPFIWTAEHAPVSLIEHGIEALEGKAALGPSETLTLLFDGDAPLGQRVGEVLRRSNQAFAITLIMLGVLVIAVVLGCGWALVSWLSTLSPATPSVDGLLQVASSLMGPFIVFFGLILGIKLFTHILKIMKDIIP